MNSLLDIQEATCPIEVSLPDGSRMWSSHTAILDMPQLPHAARTVHIFQELSNSLLSIGQLCDSGCTADYNKDTVTVRDQHRDIILVGHRCPQTRLWMVNLVRPQSAATIIHHESTANQVLFYHAAMGYPVPATMQNAIDKGFLRFPGLNSDAFQKYAPYAIQTAQGHLDQTRSGIQSTKSSENEIECEPPQDKVENAQIVVKVFPVYTPSNRVHTDLTGRLPVVSKKGNQYVMVMYHEDSN